MTERMKLKTIAFYLPQYHQIKENDEWYGTYFTEWTNVKKAKPLFWGHKQPRIPGELGYYDLTDSDIRRRQAELAKEAGLSAFCYYDYWFGEKKRLLEMPITEVVKSGEPDFPFCMCWANHDWQKKYWDGATNNLCKTMLMEQKYGGKEDYTDHFYALLDAFKDRRYYKLQEKLVYVIYEPTQIPDLKLFVDTWQELAQKEGLPAFYFVGYFCYTNIELIEEQKYKVFDSYIVSYLGKMTNVSSRHAIQYLLKAKIAIAHFLKIPVDVHSYRKYVSRLQSDFYKNENIFPEVIPNWDVSPRRQQGALILKNARPEYFKQYLRNIVNLICEKKEENQVVFIKSWNEWGEGNYMEPDEEFGKGYINVLKEVVKETNK